MSVMKPRNFKHFYRIKSKCPKSFCEKYSNISGRITMRDVAIILMTSGNISSEMLCGKPGWHRNMLATNHVFHIPGGADAVQRLAHQAHEWDPEWHQGAEAVRLGELLQREGSGYSAEGAPCVAQDGLPWRCVYCGLDQCSFPGIANSIAHSAQQWNGSSAFNPYMWHHDSREQLIWFLDAVPFSGYLSGTLPTRCTSLTIRATAATWYMYLCG